MRNQRVRWLPFYKRNLVSFALVAMRTSDHQIFGAIRAATRDRNNVIDVITLINRFATPKALTFLCLILAFNVVMGVTADCCKFIGSSTCAITTHPIAVSPLPIPMISPIQQRVFATMLSGFLSQFCAMCGIVIAMPHQFLFVIPFIALSPLCTEILRVCRVPFSPSLAVFVCASYVMLPLTHLILMRSAIALRIGARLLRIMVIVRLTLLTSAPSTTRMQSISAFTLNVEEELHRGKPFVAQRATLFDNRLVDHLRFSLLALRIRCGQTVRLVFRVVHEATLSHLSSIPQEGLYA